MILGDSSSLLYGMSAGLIRTGLEDPLRRGFTHMTAGHFGCCLEGQLGMMAEDTTQHCGLSMRLRVFEFLIEYKSKNYKA